MVVKDEKRLYIPIMGMARLLLRKLGEHVGPTNLE